jgi:hypothetical protein
MGLLSFFRKLLGREATRKVARLESDDLDRIEETIDLGGGPLKPEHRRLALRDRRLLPKPKPPAAARPLIYAVRQRPKYLSADEAARLFSGTLRTRDRKLRDLLTDPAQLERLGLPIWRTEEEVAAGLGLDQKRLRHYSIHRQRERVVHYVQFAIPKRGGGERLILAPKRQLKAVQRRLLELLVNKLPVSGHAHGFRAGRSIRSNAEPHVGRRVVVKLDIRDFFASVHVGRVRGLLIAYGYSYPVAAVLAALMTEAPRQPVVEEGVRYFVPVGSRHCVPGAPTSPGLCNALLLSLDHRLAGLARRFGFEYTRYADDLTFSGDDAAAAPGLIRLAAAILRAEGFAANPAKTRILRSGGRQTVTGVVVNRDLGLSRQERRRLRAALHQQRQRPEGIDPRLRGKLAYLAMLNPAQAARLLESGRREPLGNPAER